MSRPEGFAVPESSMPGAQHGESERIETPFEDLSAASGPPAGLSVGDEDLGDLGGPSAGQGDAGRARDGIGRH
jgi:hypothetical protein